MTNTGFDPSYNEIEKKDPTDKLCRRGCGTRIIFKGRIFGKRGSTGWFEYDNTRIEHTYKRCNTIIEKNTEFKNLDSFI